MSNQCLLHIMEKKNKVVKEKVCMQEITSIPFASPPSPRTESNTLLIMNKPSKSSLIQNHWLFDIICN